MLGTSEFFSSLLKHCSRTLVRGPHAATVPCIVRGRRAPTTTEPHHGTYVAPIDSRERSRAGVFRAPQHRVPIPTSERRSNIRSTVIRWIANRPDEVELPEWNRREAELIATDPDCVPPLALPPLETGIMLGSMSGVELSKAAQEAARTIPAREHGGNCDIKNISCPISPM